ncbi:hypothetical protein ACFY3U_25420 [Micromonospora sp. NPDC000089]|uniref:hypothetical protein n=1 Tax=unclassified Micromonospora TaxID=2617518 RepID=UPI0036AA883B
MLAAAYSRPFWAATPRAMRDLVRLALTALVLAGGLGAAVATPAAAAGPHPVNASAAGPTAADPATTAHLPAPGTARAVTGLPAATQDHVTAHAPAFGIAGLPATVVDRGPVDRPADAGVVQPTGGAGSTTAGPAPAAVPLPSPRLTAASTDRLPVGGEVTATTDPVREATGRRGPPRR